MGADLYRTVFQLYQAPEYYLVIIFVVVLCLWRDVTWKFYARTDLPQYVLTSYLLPLTSHLSHHAPLTTPLVSSHL